MFDTDLMEAVKKGDLKGVKRNLSQAGKQDGYGGTALMWAAINGRADFISLLEKEIGMQDNRGWTALMLAAHKGNTDCARLLLSEAGKQTTGEWIGFPPGTTALMTAAHRNYPEIVELLLPYEQGMTDSKGHTAQWHANSSPEKGDFTEVRKLLENEGTERIPPPREECLLMASAITGDIEGVRKHLDRVGYQDPTGTTALMMAASYGHSNCIPFLEREIGMQSNDGTTALMKAAMKGHTSCIPLLEKEIGMQDNSGWTALMLAAYHGNTDCARLLFSEAGKQTTKSSGITSNGKTVPFPSGMTALMPAAYFNRPEIVQLLLPYEQGLKDSEGHTAKWYANNSPEKGDFTQVRQLLEDEGIERLPPSSPGLTNQEHINKLTAEIESLKKDLFSSKNALEETRKELSQLNQENSSLKQQLDNAINESKRHAEMNEDLRKASDQNRALINASPPRRRLFRSSSPRPLRTSREHSQTRRPRTSSSRRRTPN
ncbi:Ankyrin repeat protein 1 [Giardia muris]|uniref:Ankyrin repeat protein 1 n=1 Tax=Giardia muris TaxID=5742 RepID=A0A4Z1T0V2_GIAMU|nr:Ankyrin repeat protein 1 [Giardia muris]|eukprot:TNJ26149.1 Ankyrin repeat protein 1 [Giardia muris]